MKTTVIPLHFVLSETNPAKIPPEKQVKQQLWELFFDRRGKEWTSKRSSEDCIYSTEALKNLYWY